MSYVFLESDEDGWEELALAHDAHDLFRAVDRAYTSGREGEPVDWLYEHGYLDEGENEGEQVAEVRCVIEAGSLFEGGAPRGWVRWRRGTANYTRVMAGG